MPDSLRKRVVRLAKTRPELRRHLLPLLKQASGKNPAQDVRSFQNKMIKDVTGRLEHVGFESVRGEVESDSGHSSVYVNMIFRRTPDIPIDDVYLEIPRRIKMSGLSEPSIESFKGSWNKETFEIDVKWRVH